jgi:hypothetical protein
MSAQARRRTGLSCVFFARSCYAAPVSNQPTGGSGAYLSPEREPAQLPLWFRGQLRERL